MEVRRLLSVSAILVAVAACAKSESGTVDSAAGIHADSGAGLAVQDVEFGRQVDTANMITVQTEAFAPTDTIFAAVHTTGATTSGFVTGQWFYQDTTLLHTATDTVTTAGDARSVFFISDPNGLPKGKYTLHVLIGGTEALTKDATVK